MHHHLSVKTIKTAVLLAVATICTYQADASARAFFVSPTGDGSDGMTWKKAWKDPAQINWASVNPGDQIVLDGGTSGITYETSFTIPKSGTAGAPIVVRQSPQAGHNGKITLYGGSDKPPAGYNTGIPTGVNIAGSYVHFVGARRAGIKMYSYRTTCINLAPGTQNSTVRNIEIENRVSLPPYGAIICSGMEFAGYNNQVIDCDFRNCFNGARENAPAGANNRVIFRECTFGSTQHFGGFSRGCGTGITSASPLAPAHTTEIVSHRNIFGPYLTIGVIMHSGKLNATDNLFLGESIYMIDAEPQFANTTDVRVNRCTFITPFYPVVLSPTNPFPPKIGMLGFPIRTNGIGTFKVANSIFYGGTISVPAAFKVNAGGNFQYRVAGNTTALAGVLQDPQLVDGPAINALPDDYVPYTLSTLNYAPLPTSPAVGKGSQLTTVSELTAPYGPTVKIPVTLGGP
ncbi:MAG: hypothetical protein IPL73_30495 [Candidatus Obscuribacter sp.]|nr:hypothetical protein [Candidatus Obscuribacter sp.]